MVQDAPQTEDGEANHGVLLSNTTSALRVFLALPVFLPPCVSWYATRTKARRRRREQIKTNLKTYAVTYAVYLPDYNRVPVVCHWSSSIHRFAELSFFQALLWPNSRMRGVAELITKPPPLWPFVADHF